MMTPVQTQQAHANRLIFQRALRGDDDAIERLINSDAEPTATAAYDSYYEETLPVFFSEGVFEEIVNVPIGTPDAGKYALDINVAWKINSNNSRLSGVRAVLNGIPTDTHTRETNSSGDIASVFAFTDFQMDGLTPLTITIEGILQNGGGAANFELTAANFRIFSVASTGFAGVTARPPRIIVPGAGP